MELSQPPIEYTDFGPQWPKPPKPLRPRALFYLSAVFLPVNIPESNSNDILILWISDFYVHLTILSMDTQRPVQPYNKNL